MSSNNMTKSFAIGSALMMAVASGCAKQEALSPKDAMNKAAMDDAHMVLVPVVAPLEGGVVLDKDAPEEETSPSRVIDTKTAVITDPATGKKKRQVISEEQQEITERQTVSTITGKPMYGAMMMRGQGMMEEGTISTASTPVTKKDIQARKAHFTSTVTMPKALKAAALLRSVTGAAYEGTGAYNNVMQGKAADKRVYDENTVIQNGGTQVQSTKQETKQIGATTNIKEGDVKVGVVQNTEQKTGVVQQVEQNAKLQAVQNNEQKTVVPVQQNNEQKTVVPVQQNNEQKTVVPVQQNNNNGGGHGGGHGGGNDDPGCYNEQCAIPTRSIHTLPNGMKVAFNAPKHVIA